MQRIDDSDDVLLPPSPCVSIDRCGYDTNVSASFHCPEGCLKSPYSQLTDSLAFESSVQMVSDSKQKRLEARAAKAAAKGDKAVSRVSSKASLKKVESVADSLASQMEDGTS
jgi:hypothetical protein